MCVSKRKCHSIIKNMFNKMFNRIKMFKFFPRNINTYVKLICKTIYNGLYNVENDNVVHL